MKKRTIKIVVLSVIFVAAIIFFSVITNQENKDMTISMEEATLPTISFEVEGYLANPLVGYVKEMEIPAMRDSITPLDKNGETKISVQEYEAKIKRLIYQVYTLDGSRMLMEKSALYEGEDIIIDPGTVLKEDVEAVLKVTLEFDENREAYYYTRIVNPRDFHVKECIGFAKQLHDFMIAGNVDSIAPYMEPDGSADNDSLQHVNIHSSASQAAWGEMEPAIAGDVWWDIKETNETYTSVVLKYVVESEEDGIKSSYDVEEFFKVRKLGEKYYLLVYERTMNERFQALGSVLVNQGIDLGIASEEQEFLVREDGEMVAFVIQRELWCYDRREDSLTQVFGFRDLKKEDARNLYNEHDIRLVEMDKDGNLTFMVYGYMNRGNHEGEVGVSFYHYIHSKNLLREKAFIANDKSFAVSSDELCRLVYFATDTEELYLLMNGTLHKISLLDRTEKNVVENLQEGQYVLSEDGHLLAYQVDETTLAVLNMETGKSRNIEAYEGTNICPLGFVYDDFIFGSVNKKDEGKTLSGTLVNPMFKVEICDNNLEVIKTYEEKGIFVSEVFVEDNLITLKRMKNVNGKYQSVEDDFITNNEEVEQKKIYLKAYNINAEQRQYRLEFEERLEDKSPKVLSAKQVMVEDLYTKKIQKEDSKKQFYVYGAGKLIGIYNRAGYAIQEANEKEGVVVSSNQTYVWERGNYDAWYQIYELRGKSKIEGETSLEAALRIVLEYEGVEGFEIEGKEPMEVLEKYSGEEALDLTGSSAEDLCYMVGKGTPVIAMTGENSAVLFVGYYNNTIVYLDPNDGVTRTCSFKDMDEKTAKSGNCYIGYAKGQEYE